MKKRQIWNFLSLTVLFLLIIVLTIQPAFAIEITLSKDIYQLEETLQAEISGNFISLTAENTVIYEKGIPRITPVISDLTKQGDKYYFYAVLPNKEGDFSFVIENTGYVLNGEIQTDPLIKNFTIKKGNQSYLSINPGFIVTSKDFSLKLKSPVNNKLITATIEATNQSKTLNLIEQEEKNLDFSIAGINSKRTNIKITDYNIPVFILSSVISPDKQELIFSPEKLKATLTPGESYLFKISIANFGNKNITDIRLLNNLNAQISPEAVPLLKKGEITVIDVTVPVPADSKGNLSGEITAQYGAELKKIEVFLEITKNQSDVNLNGTTAIPGLKCEGRGKICVYPEKCTSETTESIEGPCCLGDCAEPKPPADYGWIFGLALLAVLGLVAFFLIKKARRKKPKTSEEILEEKTQRFDKRMNPKPEEVSGKLGRV